MDFRYGGRELYHAQELIAVGDIHGECEKLKNLLEQVIPFLESNSKCHLVFCGDLCNRGPGSAKVFKILIDLKKEFPQQTFFIMGNHEEMFLTTLQGESWWTDYTFSTWDSMQRLWKKPMLSVQELVEACKEEGILDFLDNLIPYYENDSFLCTHAPLDRTLCYAHGLKTYADNFDKIIHKQEFFLEKLGRSLRWGFSMEDPKLCKIPEMKKYHICGHQFKHHKQPRLYRHRAFIDVGCGCRKDKPLVAVKFPGKKVYKSFNKSI